MAAAVEKVVNGHHQIIIVLISFWMAVGRRQPGVGLSHPEVDLPPEQHLLLLLRFPDGPHSGREISGRLSPDHLQTDHRLEDKKWKVVFFFFKNAWDKFYIPDRLLLYLLPVFLLSVGLNIPKFFETEIVTSPVFVEDR